MSLLQEALKRKEQDESQSQKFAELVEGAAFPPPLPADNAHVSDAGQQAVELNTGNPPDSPPQSMPVAGPTQATVSQNILASAKPGRRKVSWLWVIVTVIAVFIGLTVTAGIAFFFYQVSWPAKAKTVQQAGPINNTTAAGATGTNISAGQLISAHKPKPESAIAAEITAHQSAAPAAKTEPTAAIAQTQIVAVAHNAESKPTPAKLAFFKPKASPAVSQSAKWPALKLMGILRGAGKTESTAFINGKMISAGQTIADVTIVEIQADGVILKYGNEKRFLRVGATSY